MKIKNKIIAFLSVLTVALTVLISLFSYNLYTYYNSPAGENNAEKIFVVKPGQGFSSVTAKLVREKLIVSPEKFKIVGALTGDDKKVKAGEYLFSMSMSPRQIITLLKKGKVHLYKMTVPEGYNIYQVAEVVANSGFGLKDDFIIAAKNAKLMAKNGLPDSAETFEGYLFPDTYSFPRGVKHSEIIRVMYDRFRSVYKTEWTQRARKMGFTRHEIITLASIIEKETGDARERPVISSVFHNRLKKRMRLETDPTVIYGIKNFDGNITKKHLREKTPYNTYRMRGLPPGPIANPGIKAIEAALYPADTDYLFFVSKKDTTHQFSTNIRDHINSVRKYQLRRKR